jgi:hypothetical protein|tara:strand:- start:4641 stop:5705 length:1065 start_codon:yes stop_codon:yes gene_type:complete
MKILNVMIGLFMVLLIVPIVLGSTEFGNVIKGGGKLIITDVDVKVGSKTDKNMDFGDKIKEEAKPGDTVKFTIQAENNFTDDEGLEIEDIQVTVTIDSIDDDSDLEEDDTIKDLKDGKDDDVTIEFTIPLEVDEGDYDVLIVVEGEDENRTDHEVQYELEIEVQKEDNEVLFSRNSLSPSEIKCGRTVQLSTAVINTGADDEDDVVLDVVNSELGINFRETFDLTNDPFDDDSKFRKSFTLSIPEEVATGIYSIPATVTFNDGSDTETVTAELIVDQCEIFEEDEEEEDVVVVQDTTPADVITAGTVTTPTLPVIEESSLFESKGFLTALVVGEVLLVIIAILIVVAVVRKRGE